MNKRKTKKKAKKICVWGFHKRFDTFVRPSCEPTSIKFEHNAELFRYCPFCGKKIIWNPN